MAAWVHPESHPTRDSYRSLGQTEEMRNAVCQSRREVLDELYATGVLVVSSADDAIIAELTSSSAWGDELRRRGDSDPDLRDD